MSVSLDQIDTIQWMIEHFFYSEFLRRFGRCEYVWNSCRSEDNSGGPEGPRSLFWLSIWSINITRLTASSSHAVSRVPKSFQWTIIQ